MVILEGKTQVPLPCHEEKDERGWEEVAKERLRTRCCQTGTLILAPLLITSVTEGKLLNPSGFSFQLCSPEASSVYRAQQTLKAQPQSSIPANRSRQC